MWAHVQTTVYVLSTLFMLFGTLSYVLKTCTVQNIQIKNKKNMKLNGDEDDNRASKGERQAMMN